MFSLVVLAAITATQPNDSLAAANKAFADRDWPRAAELYKSVVQAHPEQASSWARLGRSLREAGRAREALPALQKAEQLVFFPPLIAAHYEDLDGLARRKFVLCTFEEEIVIVECDFVLIKPLGFWAKIDIANLAPTPGVTADHDNQALTLSGFFASSQ